LRLHVKAGADRVHAGGRHFLELVFVREGLIFGETAYWDPYAVRDAQLNGRVESRAVCGGLGA